MNEITKLYKNAGIVLRKCSECDNNMDCGYGKDCYPPFTAEKQIELIKWLIVHSPSTCLEDEIIVCAFEDSLANIINTIWQDLTKEEKEVVRGILRT